MCGSEHKLLVISILWISFNCPLTNAVHPHKERDNMGRLDREKMMTLAEEIIKDTKVMQRQVHSIRQLHSSSLGYEFGLIIGKIREKYRRMMDIYAEAQNRLDNTTYLRPPGIEHFVPLHWIISMELIRTLEIDIDKLVQVSEMVPKDLMHAKVGGGNFESDRPPVDKDPPGTSPPPPSPPPPPSSLRMGAETSSPVTPLAKYVDEEDLKKHYREEYNRKKGHKGLDYYE